MTFKIACGDVMPGCTARFESTDRSQLMGDLARHAASAHGITSISPDLASTIESRIVAA